MSRPNTNDISIGQDRWISFVDVSGRQGRAVNLDPLIKPMEPFWSALETECVVGCCGIDAFSLWPEDIQRASALVNASELRDQLSTLLSFIESSGSDIFRSSHLNNFFDKTVILQIIEHICEHTDRPNES